MIGFAAAFAALALQGTPALETDRREIDVSYCDVFFFVEVAVEKEDPDAPDSRTVEEKTLSFVYDTGASYSVVDDDALFEATGKRIAKGKRVNIQNTRSGDVSFKTFRARVTDLDHLSTAFGQPIEGILAHNAFSGWRTVMDYEKGALFIERGELPKPDGKTILRTDGPDDRPWINLNINGKKRRVLVDSGSNSGFSLNRLSRYPLSAGPVKTGVSTRLNRFEDRYTARLDGTIDMGPLTLQDPLLRNAQKTELLGGQILRHAKVTYDAANERIKIEPYKDSVIAPPPSARSDGVILRPKGDAVEVIQIIEGFEENARGIEVGDLVTAINGEPITDRTCPVAGERAPEQRTLTVKRADETFDITLPLLPIVE